MREDSLREILRQLGVRVVDQSASGWLEASCPLAPWRHAGGTDRSPSFGARASEDRPSGWHCHTCHGHGRVSTLVRMLWRHGADVGVITDPMVGPDLAVYADRADAMGALVGDFAKSYDVEAEPEPLDEEVYYNVFDHAHEVPGCRDYVRGRHVGDAAMRSLGLRYDPEQHRVVFPVRGRDGLLYGFTGRAINPDTVPKVRDYSGLPKRSLVLGAERWRGGTSRSGGEYQTQRAGDGGRVQRGYGEVQSADNREPDGTEHPTTEDAHRSLSRPLVLVEGLFAYACLVALRLERVADVGCLMGNRLTRAKAEIVRDHSAPTFLLLDNDAGGDVGLYGALVNGAHQGGGAVDLLREHVPVYVPAWPEGKDDPDQLTRREIWDMLTRTRMTT